MDYNYTDNSNLIEGNKLIKNNSQINQNDVYFDRHDFSFLIFLSVASGALLVILFVYACGEIDAGLTSVAPLSVWFLLIFSSVIFYLLASNVTYQIIFSRKKQKIIKRILFFSIEYDVNLLNFNKIKMLGISSTFKRVERKHSSKIVDKHYLVCLYGPNLSFITIDEGDFSSLNANAKLASELVHCRFIEGDGCSRLVKDNNVNSALPIRKINIEDQLDMQANNKIILIALGLLIIFVVCMYAKISGN